MTSYLGVALQRVLDAAGLPQRRFAELAEMDQGLLHRYLAGKVRPSREVMERIARAIPDEADRAAVVIAHLRDETPITAAGIIQILSLVGSSSVREDEAPSSARLPAKVRKDFDFLMQLAENQPEVSDWIRSTVDVLKGR